MDGNRSIDILIYFFLIFFFQKINKKCPLFYLRHAANA